MNKEPDIEILYRIIGNMQKINMPVSIKGGLALKAILKQYNADIDRKTRDIDMDWLRTPPDMEEIRDALHKAMQITYPDYNIVVSRPFGEHQSAGFQIVDKNGDLLTKIDVDVDKAPDISIYKIQDIMFNGASIENIMADKISALSTRHVFRRAKDLLDVYAIEQYVPYNRQKLISCLKNKPLEDFSTLKTNKDAVKHAYDKLEDVENKPDFDTVYQSDIQFFENILQEIQKATSATMS